MTLTMPAKLAGEVLDILSPKTSGTLKRNNGKVKIVNIDLRETCYDMAFQQVIIISFNLILSGGTYLIWKISSYP